MSVKFLTYLAMVPKIAEIVQVVEKLVPLPGKGKEKLDLVLSYVEKLSETAMDEELRAKVTDIVDTTVQFLNDMGVFKKASEQ